MSHLFLWGKRMPAMKGTGKPRIGTSYSRSIYSWMLLGNNKKSTNNKELITKLLVVCIIM